MRCKVQRGLALVQRLDFVSLLLCSENYSIFSDSFPMENIPDFLVFGLSSSFVVCSIYQSLFEIPRKEVEKLS